MAILNVVIEDELKARIDQTAAAEDRTIRSVVASALELYFVAKDPRRAPGGLLRRIGCLLQLHPSAKGGSP